VLGTTLLIVGIKDKDNHEEFFTVLQITLFCKGFIKVLFKTKLYIKHEDIRHCSHANGQRISVSKEKSPHLPKFYKSARMSERASTK
jgi:hypothetical protein